MEHIEEAGIHSGDSSCVIPPQGITGEVQDTVRDYVRRIALRLGVIGLLNIQLAFRRGKVYVLEANPRSSRTIPFVSKATGVPLAKLAAKVMLGHTLTELGFTEEPRPTHISVKEVVLPFDKLPGADPLLGPEMKSTGEVMGIDRNFDLAFFKAALAASNALPTSGTVFISVNNVDKPIMVPAVKEMSAMGLNLVGTSGTAEYMSQHGVEVRRLKKIYEGSPNVVDLMETDDVQLIINTPTAYLARRDGYDIRRNAVDYGVPYLTTVQAALAAVKAMKAMRDGDFEVRSLQEYLGLDTNRKV
jgi:carbamoyl-phosphate synthase large subunit